MSQVEDPVITIDPKAEAGYRDSLARHESSGAIWHYTPHRCQNRHGRYGWVDEYILLDLDGRLIRRLEGEPRRLADGYYVMARKSSQKTYYGNQEYGMFDKDLNPITGFVFGMEPKAISFLNTQQKIQLLKQEVPSGYGSWVAYMREGLMESFIVIDPSGKTLEIKPD